MKVNTTNEISIICLNSLDDAMTHTQESGYTLCMPDTVWGGGETSTERMVFCGQNTLYGDRSDEVGNEDAGGKPG